MLWGACFVTGEVGLPVGDDVGDFVAGERLGWDVGRDVVGALVGLGVGAGDTADEVSTVDGPGHSCLQLQGHERIRSVTSLAENPTAWSTPQSKDTWLSHGRKNLLRKSGSSLHFPPKQVSSSRERENTSALSAAIFAPRSILPSRERDAIASAPLSLIRSDPVRSLLEHPSTRQLLGQRWSSSSASWGGMPTWAKAWQSTWMWCSQERPRDDT